jgi:prepilin-type N-terminal cleavage/methylation domain-containing protein
MMVCVSTLLALVNANRKAHALQSVMNNLNIALDGIVRSARMGSNYHGAGNSFGCGGTDYINPHDCPEGGDTLAFQPFGNSPTDQPWIYRFEIDNDGIGRITKSEDGNAPIPITAPEVSIEDLSFYVVGTISDDPGHLIQPKIIIVVKGTAGAEGSSARTSLPMKKRGFTLIETLVAVALLSVAIVAPMVLTARSLATSYYARDQITAFYLAQEAIEGIRAIRDAQVLLIAQSPESTAIDLFGPIPMNDQPFIIDARQIDPENSIVECISVCPPLQTDPETHSLYGYDIDWIDTTFTRTVRASAVGSSLDEIRISVTVSWRTGAFQVREFSISENLYRWVEGQSEE